VIAKKETQAKKIGIVDHSGALGLAAPASFTPSADDALEKIRKVAGPGKMDQIAPMLASATTLELTPFARWRRDRRRCGGRSALFEFPRTSCTRAGRVYQEDAGPGRGRARCSGSVGAERPRPSLDADLMDHGAAPERSRWDGTFAPQDLLREVRLRRASSSASFLVSIMISSGFMLQRVGGEENRVIR
jgi:hypothetical protein